MVKKKPKKLFNLSFSIKYSRAYLSDISMSSFMVLENAE
jgi:hypothetical protein